MRRPHRPTPPSFRQDQAAASCIYMIMPCKSIKIASAILRGAHGAKHLPLCASVIRRRLNFQHGKSTAESCQNRKTVRVSRIPADTSGKRLLQTDPRYTAVDGQNSPVIMNSGRFPAAAGFQAAAVYLPIHMLSVFSFCKNILL